MCVSKKYLYSCKTTSWCHQIIKSENSMPGIIHFLPVPHFNQIVTSSLAWSTWLHSTIPHPIPTSASHPPESPQVFVHFRLSLPF